MNLPVANSFFPFSKNNNEQLSFYSENLTLTRDAPFIKEAIKSGMIDCVHSWGDFNPSPPAPDFLKVLANRFSDELAAEQIKIKVWINHGSPNNVQNLKSRLQDRYQGDDPKSPYYTLNQIKKLSVKFYWDSEIIPWPLSGNRRKRIFANLYRDMSLYVKNGAKIAIGYKHRLRSSADNRLLGRSTRLRDGSQMIRFSRFNRHPTGCWTLPTRHTIQFSLNRRILKNLIKEEGYLILYTHLGLPSNRSYPLFPRSDRLAFEYLAELYHDGYIWVAPTSRLLTYWMTNKYLKWRTRSEGNWFIIEILSIDDPVEGSRKPEINELCGLAFYTADPHRTEIRVCGDKARTRIYPSDHTSRQSVGFDPYPSPSIDLLGG